MDVSPSNPALGKLPDFAPGFLLHARTRLNLHFSWNTSRVHPGEQDPILGRRNLLYHVQGGLLRSLNGLIYKWVTGVISPLQVRALLLTAFPGPTGPPAVMPSSSPPASRMIHVFILEFTNVNKYLQTPSK